MLHKVFVFEEFIIPFADGSVSGYINNQFSMDEHEGILRVTTTENQPLSSSVFCLD